MSNEKTPTFVKISPFAKLYEIFGDSSLQCDIYRQIDPKTAHVTYVMQISKRINNLQERLNWSKSMKKQALKNMDTLKQTVKEILSADNKENIASDFKLVIKATYVWKTQQRSLTVAELSW